MTKFSIITVVKNGALTIEQTIKSVISQTYSNFEYIIIDGKSTDGTVEIIERYHNNIAHIVSEPDQGIYEAMNKGLAVSSGDIIVFLNSDDWFADDTLAVVEKHFEDESTDIVYGDFIISHTGMQSYTKPCRIEAGELLSCPLFCHQALFARKKVFEFCGKFDLKYKLAADYNWVLNAFSNNYKFVYVNKALCYYSDKGLSGKYAEEDLNEMLAIAYSYLDKRNINKTKIDQWYMKNIIRVRGKKFFDNLELYHSIDWIKDIFKELKIDSNVIIYGCGYYGRLTARLCHRLGVKVEYFIDSFVNQAVIIDGLEVKEKKVLRKKPESVKIIITPQSCEKEIGRSLTNMGFKIGEDFYYLSDLLERILLKDELVEKKVYAE